MVARKPNPSVIATGAPRRTVVATAAPTTPRAATVLQSSRAPAQLPLFLRPNGLR